LLKDKRWFTSLTESEEDTGHDRIAGKPYWHDFVEEYIRHV
jgi:hypothetical protein